MVLNLYLFCSLIYGAVIWRHYLENTLLSFDSSWDKYPSYLKSEWENSFLWGYELVQKSAMVIFSPALILLGLILSVFGF
ncbi:MAG: hypothetical protein ACRCXZ_10835 [Patescibacteria group bacterium]